MKPTNLMRARRGSKTASSSVDSFSTLTCTERRSKKSDGRWRLKSPFWLTRYVSPAMLVSMAQGEAQIVFERRLGLAQLLALLIVLGFVVLTRGSQATLIRPLTQRSRPYGTLPGRDELARRTLGAQSACAFRSFTMSFL